MFDTHEPLVGSSRVPSLGYSCMYVCMYFVGIGYSRCLCRCVAPMAGAIPRDFSPPCRPWPSSRATRCASTPRAPPRSAQRDVTIFTLPEGKLFPPTFSIGGLSHRDQGGHHVPQHLRPDRELHRGVWRHLRHLGMTFYNHLQQACTATSRCLEQGPPCKILQLQADRWRRHPRDRVRGALPDRTTGSGPWARGRSVHRPHPRVPHLHQVGVAGRAGGGRLVPVNPRYRIDGLYATVDMLSLSPVYDRGSSTDKLSKSPLSLPYTNYTCVPCATSPVGAIEVRWEHVRQRPRSGSWAPCCRSPTRPSTSPWTPSRSAPPTSTRACPWRMPTPSPSSESTFEVNAVRYPNVGMRLERGDDLQSTLEALNENQDITSRPHPNLDSAAALCRSGSWTPTASPTTTTPRTALACGLSGMGQNPGGLARDGHGQPAACSHTAIILRGTERAGDRGRAQHPLRPSGEFLPLRPPEEGAFSPPRPPWEGGRSAPASGAA